MRIRVVKTNSNAKAVQVVSYQNNKRVILKHIGSAHSDDTLKELMILANEWVKDYTGQLSIFSDSNPNSVLHTNHSSFIGVKYHLFYRQIRAIQRQIGFDGLPALLNDLVAIRIFEPASKLRSLALLEQYFGIIHSRKNFYKIAPECVNLKGIAEEKVVHFAREHYSFDYDLLFYDVTTLYFETFEEDELRRNGFSKDNKFQQPQILVALMVTKEGFPIAYEVFPGNTFEGHTIVPVIKDFIARNRVKNLTVIADAAMISTANIKQLTQNNINYIVGARLGNVADTMVETIDKKICREDGKSIRIKTSNGYLVCSYSSVRYRKDKYEMEKQIEKAKEAVTRPSKNKKLKFIKTKDEHAELNEALIEKTKKLLGIKGYYTNLEEKVVSNKIIIERYHELYRIEQTFRISKSDLQTRPIYHFKEQPIRLHILVCFMALVVSKHIEIRTGTSINRFIQEAKKNADGEIINHITQKIITIKAHPTQKMNELIEKLFSPH
ncbi:MAG: IS1634 family transposase [Tenuifilum sp.]|jgi:transposase|uniref:IS1634 family transposase n=1 Tax=Tenuifilum sp. TaxID=2760880 RepID=UPI002C68FF6C|nr:IS1634 family transposase [Tenuifilum sp.]HPP89120.1 IS1634 family transposase [Tenuifilum sp.]